MTDEERAEAEKNRREAREKLLRSVIKGALDPGGHKIDRVYSIYDECVIYKQEEYAGFDGLKVLIYGKSDDSETELIRRLQIIKVELDKLKGKGDRFDNPSHISRAANALSMAIVGADTDRGISILNEISKQIDIDYHERVKGKLCYLGGAMLVSLIATIIALCFYLKPVCSGTCAHLENVFLVAAFATYGGLLSVSRTLATIAVDRGLGVMPYLAHGAGRMAFSILGGLFLYVAIRGNLVLGFTWNAQAFVFPMLAWSFLAGFSETLVPNALGRIEQTDQSGKK